MSFLDTPRKFLTPTTPPSDLIYTADKTFYFSPRSPTSPISPTRLPIAGSAEDDDEDVMYTSTRDDFTPKTLFISDVGEVDQKLDVQKINVSTNFNNENN